jgi:hypothetical protein
LPAIGISLFISVLPHAFRPLVFPQSRRRRLLIVPLFSVFQYRFPPDFIQVIEAV